MMRKMLIETEDLLNQLPRIVLLALAVFILRNPIVGGLFMSWAWYFKMPCEFVVVVSAALALCAGIRVAAGHRDDRA